MTTRRSFLQSGAVAAAALATGAWPARAANAPGVTDDEIKIGQTMPYSGPLSAYGVIGRTEAAYFKMINEQGGMNGRKLNLISLDDAYSPPKTVEQIRRLVEQEQVAFLFNTLGTPPNLAIRQYLNDNKVPQLFVSPAPLRLATRSIFLGRWVSSRTTRRRRVFTPSTSFRPSRTPRSQCSIKTTASARTT